MKILKLFVWIIIIFQIVGFSVSVFSQNRNNFNIIGAVKSKSEGKLIEMAKVSFYSDDVLLDNKRTHFGRFQFNANGENNYLLEIGKKGYFTLYININKFPEKNKLFLIAEIDEGRGSYSKGTVVVSYDSINNTFISNSAFVKILTEKELNEIIEQEKPMFAHVNNMAERSMKRNLRNDSIMKVILEIKDSVMAMIKDKSKKTEIVAHFSDDSVFFTRHNRNRPRDFGKKAQRPSETPETPSIELEEQEQIISESKTEIAEVKVKIEDARKQLKNEWKNAKTREDSLEVKVKELSLNENENQILLAEEQLKMAQKQIDLQKLEIKNQKIIIYFSVGGLIVVLSLLIISILQYRAKKRANNLLTQKNLHILQQNEEIATQRDEIEAQRDLVTKQKDQMEVIHKELTDSIHYALRIQRAVLPSDERIKGIINEYFIFYKPKDIVSGDFYWFSQIKDTKIFAVADCTGHGVPGAFMSMLSSALLNEIIRQTDEIIPSKILNLLRINIINSLQQRGVQGEQKDGMDIAMCVLKFESKDKYELQFAGAGNPMFIVKSANEAVEEEYYCKEYSNDKNRLYEIKGDKMPISIYDKMDEFTNHNISVNSGDKIYLSSDGYFDQFGGPNGKKYKQSQFKKMIVDIQGFNLAQQKEIVEQTFESWKNDNCNYPQVDDICVLGVKI